jgi:hypothetical protein
MGELRFNHMELTVPRGSLTTEQREAIGGFYGEVFGFGAEAKQMFGEDCLVLSQPTGDFILVIEGDQPLSAPAFDHLGLLLPSREAVDEALATVRRWREDDERVQLKEYPDGVVDGKLFHAFYVRHLLPIWFDVQFVEPAA